MVILYFVLLQKALLFSACRCFTFVCLCVFVYQVLSETSSSKVGSYRLFSLCSRQSPEMKQSGLGRFSYERMCLTWGLMALTENYAHIHKRLLFYDSDRLVSPTASCFCLSCVLQDQLGSGSPRNTQAAALTRTLVLSYS